MPPIKLAFIGFRHGHILALHDFAARNPMLSIVAASEDDPQARAQAQQAGVRLTHDNYVKLLDEVECDAVAVGDYYQRHGRIAIDALSRGRHVILDKPICTAMAELSEIEQLATARKLCIGCQLDLRAAGRYRTLARLVRQGAVGQVLTVAFSAQHPLNYGSRPAWYFEPGRHGGTINDIGIHAFDAIPWITGRRFGSVVAARQWNGKVPQHPHFKDCAQMMLTLDNGGGVLGDVSYLAPDSAGYSGPEYWRITIHGYDGMVEAALNAPEIIVAGRGQGVSKVKPDADKPGTYLDSFIDQVSGRGQPELSTDDVLYASRVALAVQQAADKGLRDVPV